jgi:hypothetical protein
MRKMLRAAAVVAALLFPALGPSSVGAAQAVRVGATCNDGTSSTATGSGACSHHKGVACWKYSDGTCRAR